MMVSVLLYVENPNSLQQIVDCSRLYDATWGRDLKIIVSNSKAIKFDRENGDNDSKL